MVVFTSSAATQSLKNVHLIRRFESRIQSPHLFTVDEDFDVRAYRILFVNHPKTNAGILTVQVIEHIGDARTISVDVVLLIRVGQQRAWYVDFHIAFDVLIHEETREWISWNLSSARWDVSVGKDRSCHRPEAGIW